MTQQNQNQVPYNFSDDIDPDGRIPDVEYGTHEAEIESVRFFTTQTKDPSVKIFLKIGENIRSVFVSLKKDPRFTLNYGERDFKRFVAAARGLSSDSPEAKAITGHELAEAMGPGQPLKGRRVKVESRKGKEKLPKKPGEFWTEIQFSPLAGGFRDAAPATPAPTPPPAPQVQAPPPAPAEVWWPLPANDPRRPGLTEYNAAGALR